MKDYIVEIKIKNNLLYNTMIEEGFENAAELAKASGLSPGCIGDILNLKTTLYNSRGKIRPYFLKLSEILKRLPEDLIPTQHHYGSLAKNKASVVMDIMDISYLIADHGTEKKFIENRTKEKFQKAIDRILTPREKFVLENYYGLNDIEPKTYEQLSSTMNISRERVRQIEMKALKRIKHPALKLNKLLEDIT